jgi:hypothetical protein
VSVHELPRNHISAVLALLKVASTVRRMQFYVGRRNFALAIEKAKVQSVTHRFRKQAAEIVLLSILHVYVT